MHNIKAVFFDLDGTVIDPITHEIPQSNLDTIHELAKQGIKIFIATGRSYEMLPTIPGLLSLPWSGFVCSNGQRVFDETGIECMGHYLSKNQIDQLVSFCQAEQMTVSLCAIGRQIAPLGISDDMVEAHSFFDEPLPEVIKVHHDEAIYMALIYNNRSYDFHKVEQIDGLRALPNQSTYADVVLKGISKAAGMEFLCQRYDIDMTHTMAFGDSGNDIDMLQAATIGIAMGNASDEVKACSNFITKEVGMEGIAFALKHYALIP